MAGKRKRRISAAVLAAVVVLAAGSTAVFAAWKYLMPEQMAEELRDEKLAEAFRSEDAVLVNETQEWGGYRVTLLGAVSGKNISEYLARDSQGQLKDDRFYAAVAIERADGTPMPDTSEDAYGEEPFFVSSYIKGLDPMWYNAVTMGGGYSEFVQDGIQYRMLDMENVEIFADQGIYIGVNSGTFPERDAFDFDEATGEIKRNESYDGVNALFVLPLDPAKADPEAAAEYLDHMGEEEAAAEPLEISPEEEEVDAFMSRLTEDNLEEYAEAIESTRQVCKVESDGTFHFSWEVESGAGGGALNWLDECFPDKKPGTRHIGGYSSSGTLDSLYIEVYTLNEDGTVAAAIYRPKMD